MALGVRAIGAVRCTAAVNENDGGKRVCDGSTAQRANRHCTHTTTKYNLVAVANSDIGSHDPPLLVRRKERKMFS